MIATTIEDVKKLVEAGALSKAELERRLEPGDLELLSRGAQMVGWYDIRIYARMLEILKDIEGDGSHDYLRQRGARSAERLLNAGLYQQLEYLNRTQIANTVDSQNRFLAFGRDLRLLTTLSSSIYNFMRWESLIDPEIRNRYKIQVSEATAFPDDMGWAAEGFINRMAKQHGDPDLWRWQRPAPDLIIFRMIRDL